MRTSLGVVVAALFLVNACGGSNSVTPGRQEPGKADTLACNQLGLDWATQSGGHLTEIAFGKTEQIKPALTFGLGQADRLKAAGCNQDLIREVEAGNSGVAETLARIAACLQKFTPSVEAREFCDDAVDTYERDVLTHIDRARELIARSQADY